MPGRTLDLRDKQHPSCELPEKVDRVWHLSYTTEKNAESTRKAGAALRARMSALMSKPDMNGLGDLPDMVSDCGLKRAFHDELGVRKVVFTFSDDMLTTVYRLEGAWALFEKELAGVFHAAGVNPKHVIRCLLAELGPGVSIPVHHDTGYWATKSHRVHMPLITSSLVEFYTGKTEDKLIRVPFPEFEFVELNNRAKHMVKNSWDKPRVHLIFDYVEDHQLGLLRFESLVDSDVVRQTRRTISILRASEEKTTEGEAKEENSIGDDLPALIEDEDVRHNSTSALLQRIKDAHKADPAVGNRLVREFCKLSKRYSDGEMQAAEYVAFLDRAFLNRDSAKDIVGLLFDRERAKTLCNSLQTQPATRILPSPPCPASMRDLKLFAVVGAMKCGTTSLYEYINDHPLCVRSRQKEPHAFDWVWNQMCALPGDALADKYLKAFDEPKLRADPKRFTGEATPSYLLGGAELFTRLRAACPHTRLLVILREPCERAWSHYRMTADTSNASEDQKMRRGSVMGKSFSQVIEEDMQQIMQCRINAETTIASEFEAAYLSGLPTGHGAHAYVGRGMYALQIELMLQVFPRSQILFLKLEDLARNLDAEMTKVFRFLDVEPVTIKSREKHNARGNVNADKSSADLETLRKLKAMYRDHNKRLQSLVPELDLSEWDTVQF